MMVVEIVPFPHLCTGCLVWEKLQEQKLKLYSQIGDELPVSESHWVSFAFL